MRISRYADARDNRPQAWEGDFEAFAQEIRLTIVDVDDPVTDVPAMEKRKERLPAFSPAEYPPGARRSNGAVLRLHMLVLDVDQATDEELYDFVNEAQGLAMVVASTWSRGIKPGARARVIIKLSRPVALNEWDVFWSKASALFGNIGDPQCRDPSRIYFGCFAPRPLADQHFYEVFEGEPLDVDGVLDLPVTDLPAPPPAAVKLEPVPKEQFEAFAKRLVRKTNDRLADLGRMLVQVCDGEVFAEPGNRDNAIFQLAQVIAERFPNGDPGMLASYFEKSLGLMLKIDPDCPRVENVEYKLTRAQSALRAVQAEREEEAFKFARRRVLDASGGRRSEPYTQAEWDEIVGADHRQCVVVQFGGSYYFMAPNRRGDRPAAELVGPFPKDAAGVAALTLLAPASAWVDLWNVNKQGDLTRKSIDEIATEYGTVAEDVQFDLRAQRSTFDPDTRVLTVAPCRLRNITPRFHPEIAEWLRLMTGDCHDVALTWIAAVTRLDKICSALVLIGPPGCGKTLLAIGLSRLWSEHGPTTLAQAFANFNDSLLKSPLCFADEQLPKDFRGYAQTGQLREHVQAMVRPLKKKFLPDASLVGATRTIVAANSDAVFASKDVLTANDIEAIADRLLYVEALVAGKTFLAGRDVSAWVESDLIAEHALWLRDHHKWVPEGRFLIARRTGGIGRRLAVQSGIQSAVCEWLVGYLMTRNKYDSAYDQRVLIDKGRLLARADGIADFWATYVANPPRPPTGDVATALSALSLARVRMKVRRGRNLNFRVVDPENLVAWAEHAGIATREDIEPALARDTQLDPSPLIGG